MSRMNDLLVNSWHALILLTHLSVVLPCLFAIFVLLFLGTSPYPIILHVFASSQPDVFTGIVPGKVLVCSRVLLRIEPHDSKHRKFCFATTTRESQTYLLKQPSDINSKPFRGCGIVNDVINWRQSVKAKQFLGRSCSGGFYSFPPVPDSLDSYKRTFPADSPIELTSTVNLGLLVEHLHFRQHLRVHVQGVVAAIEFIPLDVDAARGLSQTFEQTSCSQEYNLTHGGAESGEASRTSKWRVVYLGRMGQIPQSKLLVDFTGNFMVVKCCLSWLWATWVQIVKPADIKESSQVQE